MSLMWAKKANAREWKQVIFPLPLHILQELEGNNHEIYKLPLELIKNRWQTNIQVVAEASRDPNKLVKRKRIDSPVEDWPILEVHCKKQKILESVTQYFSKCLKEKLDNQEFLNQLEKADDRTLRTAF